MMYSSSPPPSNMYSNSSGSGSLETSSFLNHPNNNNRRRRRRNNSSRLLFKTKCLLSSPLLLLVMWSICLLFRSNPSSTTNSNNQYTKSSDGVVQPSSSVQQQATLQMKQTLLKTRKKHVLPNKKKTTFTQKNNIVVRPRPPPRQEENNNGLQASQEGVAGTSFVKSGTRQQQQGGVMNENAVALQASQEGVAGTNYVKSQLQGNAMPKVVNNNVPLEGNALSKEDETVATVYQNVQGQNTMMMMNENESAMQKSNPAVVSDTVPLSKGQVSVVTPLGSSNQAVDATSSNTIKTRILYYDASSGSDIPETVYDESGKAYTLASLQKEGTDVYMETTPLKTQQQQATPLKTLQQEEAPAETLKVPQAWGRSTAQDQFIVVATVATMALLVGALSARKLRTRQFLNSCIENEETLAEEYMYDAAYTTNGYDTFGGGPWKGDLEKFDV